MIFKRRYSVNESLTKNVYKIVYLNREDNAITAFIEAYSEKQAVLILRLERKDLYRVLYIDCIEDHTLDNGEQLSFFN